MSNLTETLDDAARILHQRFKAQDDRIEKMEEALSQEMAKVREMDDILAGVVKRVGYASEAPVRMVATPAQNWKDRYFQGTDPVTEGTSKMASATWGEGLYIHKAELIAWLDAEIVMAEENLQLATGQNAGPKAVYTMQSMLATYRAVKAHITGE